MSAAGIGSIGDEAASLDAAHAWNGVDADEVEGDVLADGQIMRGTRTHLLVGKDDIHTPAEAILDAPMRAGRP